MRHNCNHAREFFQGKITSVLKIAHTEKKELSGTGYD